MAVDVKSELKIPDLWYDFYARLIPGSIFVAAVRFWSLGIKTLPSTTEVIILIGFGYFVGLTTCPISSRVSEIIEEFFEKIHINNQDYGDKWLRKLQYALDRGSRDSLILSKMHGEVTFFIQIGLLTILFGIQNYFHLLPQFEYKEFTLSFTTYLVVTLLSVLISIEIECRRIKRAENIILLAKPKTYFKKEEETPQKNLSEEKKQTDTIMNDKISNTTDNQTIK